MARAAQAGVIVVVAAGNQGPAAGTISDYASSPDVITLGSIHNDRSLGNAITIAGVAPYAAFSSGDGPNPAQVISGTLFDVPRADSSGMPCSALPPGSDAGHSPLFLPGTDPSHPNTNDGLASPS